MNGTGRESDKFMLRLPDGMRERIKTVANENGRSMNAEIVHTLEKAYPEPPIRYERAHLQTLIKTLEKLPDSPELKEARNEVQRVLDQGPEGFSADDLQDLVNYVVSAIKVSFLKSANMI